MVNGGYFSVTNSSDCYWRLKNRVQSVAVHLLYEQLGQNGATLGVVLPPRKTSKHGTTACSVKGAFYPQPLRAVRLLFSSMVSTWSGGMKEFFRAVSQKPKVVIS